MRKVFGGIFMAAGILIAASGGLCSVAFLMEQGGKDIWLLVLFVGAIPVIIGVGLVVGGRELFKSGVNQVKKAAEDVKKDAE